MMRSYACIVGVCVSISASAVEARESMSATQTQLNELGADAIRRLDDAYEMRESLRSCAAAPAVCERNRVALCRTHSRAFASLQRRLDTLSSRVVGDMPDREVLDVSVRLTSNLVGFVRTVLTEHGCLEPL